MVCYHHVPKLSESLLCIRYVPYQSNYFIIACGGACTLRGQQESRRRWGINSRIYYLCDLQQVTQLSEFELPYL